MTREFSLTLYNKEDYYLLIFKDTEKIYEYFRSKYSAYNFLKGHPLKDELKVILNPKYEKDVTIKKR